MRRLAPLCLAVLGAAAASPAVALAGFPGSGPGSAGNAYPGRDGSVQTTAAPAAVAPANGVVVHAPTYDHGARCMCPDCQVKRAIEEAEGAPVIIHGPQSDMNVPCAACETSVSAGPLVPISPGEAPGYASVGGPSPGYAHVGGPSMVSGEPTPIGVVRANFAPSSPVDPSIAAFHQAAGPMTPGHNHAPAAISPAPWAGPSTRQKSMLGRMFDFRGPFTRLREAREAQQVAEHAAIPMGETTSNGRITELPASMVYGH